MDLLVPKGGMDSVNNKGLGLEMVIREIEDSSEKRAIIECCDKSYSRSITTRDNYEKTFSKIDNYAAFYAVYEEHTLAGYTALYTNDSQTKTGFITLFAIIEEMQGKHLGSALMKKCIDRSVQDGMICIRLEVLKKNEKAIGFYEHWGFMYERDCSDESIFMIKKLK